MKEKEILCLAGKRKADLWREEKLKEPNANKNLIERIYKLIIGHLEQIN